MELPEYYLDESHDVQNIMSMEEHALLNTVVAIENNDQLNYVSSLDEIYLTNIAIATIDSSATTRYYNSMQKRDVLQSTDTAINHLLLKNTAPEAHFKEVPGTSAVLISLLQAGAKQVGPKTKNQVKIIGRPKSYKIDDLSDDGGAQTIENTHEIFDEMSTTKKEFEAEYEYVESQENNVSTAVNNSVSETYSTAVGPFVSMTTLTRITVSIENTVPLNITKTGEVFYSVKENLNHQIKSSSKVLEFAGVPRSTVEITSPMVIDSNDSLPQDIEDDYIAYPETAQELEKALNKMERHLESTTPAKVRREVKELEATTSKINNLNQVAGNKSLGIDKAPMLNMVLRYIPYLKPYENDILGRVVSRSNVTRPEMFWIFVLFCMLF